MELGKCNNRKLPFARDERHVFNYICNKIERQNDNKFSSLHLNGLLFAFWSSQLCVPIMVHSVSSQPFEQLLLYPEERK